MVMCFQLELTSNYNHNSFLNDMRRLYFNAGVKDEGTTFLFTDTQIVKEEFLDDISNILNSGEVPNLYDAAEEYEKVIQGTQPSARDAGISEEDKDGIFTFFISRVRRKLHLVLCMSPVGDDFRRRCIMFPSLVSCCTIDCFVDWPQEALLSVAQDALKPLDNDELVNNLSNICVSMHESVARAAVQFYAEMRRHYYVTPSSFLHLIKLYKMMLEERKDKINQKKKKICNGLQKLSETSSVVDKLKMELVVLEPELKEKSAAAAELMERLVKEQSTADKVRQIVLTDEAVVKAKAAETQVLADDAQRDIDAAMPAMETATRALDCINKNDINELRLFNKPPHLVKFVMEAVCLLLGQKLDWASAKLVLGDTNFLKKLQEYDKDKISDALLKKLKEYVDHPDFAPEKVATQSKVCKSICMWVRALHMYAEVYRVVEPKRKRLEEAEKELNEVRSVLREKQQHLAEAEKQISQLETLYDASLAEKTELEVVIDVTANRLTRAGRLTSALGDEQRLWEESVKDLVAGLDTLVGDVLVAAGFVAYLGPFTSIYRSELLGLWISHCKQLSIPTLETPSLITVQADQHAIRQWNVCGLPRDRVSTENAILVMQATRCPLVIDPQEQANQWIRQMENANGLKTVKLTESNFMHILENGIKTGTPVLLEDVGETLDSALGPVLLKQTFFQDGRTMIRLGHADVDYDDNFRFYVTTKLPNPHYLPEIFIQATVINFTVTPAGLEEQLLSDVVCVEQPDLEQERNELVTRINSDKNRLQTIENKILKMLYASEGNILDDEDLIDTLDESKNTASILISRLMETEAMEKTVSVAREKYRALATRGSVLYFVVAQLIDIDPMYQYSLKYFNQVFNTVIYTTERVEEFAVRLQMFLDNITLAVYTNVSRGLFERHKLVFSFMLCASIFKQSGIISESQWNFLLRGPESVGMTVPKKPDIVTLSDSMWLSVNFLATNFKNFEGLLSDAALKICIRIEDCEQIINIQAANQESAQADWNSHLDDFEKLMLLKALKEEKLVFAVTSYVKGKLGQTFVESPQITLHELYRDTSCVIPLVFVLSTGLDLFEAIQCFSKEMGKVDKLRCISLGQGQGPAAEKMICLAAVKGDWVFLQNCHLATSWMLPMERLIQKLSDAQENIHPDFRLYFSTMPSRAFPVSILQNAVKVTNEPPKGLRANMKRAFLDLTTDGFEDHPLGTQWRKMIFGMCFFHAVIQERKKFGPIGWNVTYEFNDSDRECALNTVKMLCTDNTIPWDALEYIIGEITYGGRVTDYWDLRCLKTILKNFFSPSAVVDGYLYSVSGRCYCPESIICSSLEKYRSFIDELPLVEEPEIFGIHENASIPCQVQETQAMIVTIRDIQPRESQESTEKSSDDIVHELVETILGKLVEYIDIHECLPSLLWHDEKGRQLPLSTVLFQEVDRYNNLLNNVHASLDNLQKAIKGLVAMSEDLEEVFSSCLNNQIPKIWGAVAYPSLKSLGSWIRDLELRLDFVKVWLTGGVPPSYWLSGFFFPQGFLTGILQTYARKYNHPIDELKFDFVVLEVILDQENIYDAHMGNEQHEVPAVYGDIIQPEDGVIVHGLFLDAGRWDSEKMTLADPYPGEMNPPLPAMHIFPKSIIEYSGIRYVTPLYRTSVRGSVLSKTGHSSNFVTTVLLASSQPESYWIMNGTALLMQITN